MNETESSLTETKLYNGRGHQIEKDSKNNRNGHILGMKEIMFFSYL